MRKLLVWMGFFGDKRCRSGELHCYHFTKTVTDSGSELAHSEYWTCCHCGYMRVRRRKPITIEGHGYAHLSRDDITLGDWGSWEVWGWGWGGDR